MHHHHAGFRVKITTTSEKEIKYGFFEQFMQINQDVGAINRGQ